MKTVVGTCACANSLDHLDFRFFIFGLHSRNQDEFTVSFDFETEVYLPVPRGSCSNFELMRILLIIWIAVIRKLTISAASFNLAKLLSPVSKDMLRRNTEQCSGEFLNTDSMKHIVSETAFWYMQLV